MTSLAAKAAAFAALIILVSLPSDGASLKITITAPPYSIEKSSSGDLIRVEDFGGTSTPGKPMLPAKTFCIAIPPNAVVTDVRLSFPKEVELDDLYDIPAAGIPLTSAMTEEESNRLLDLRAQNYADTYYMDDPYPGSAACYAGEAKFRRYRYVRVRYWPFTYLPASRRLVHRPQLDVEIEYTLREFTDADAKSLYDMIGDVEARSFLLNYWDALSWYDDAKDQLPPPDDPVPPEGYSYVIICPPIDDDPPERLYEPLDEVKPDSPFVQWKEQLGHTVKTVTTQWIYDNYPNQYEFDGQVYTFDEPMAIKDFLEDMASGWRIRHVLLVGQNWGYEQHFGGLEDYFTWPDSDAEILLNAVPLRVCSSLLYGTQDRPSDTYFVDLDANWDLDGDRFWCEWHPIIEGSTAGGDFGEYDGQHGPDFAPDIYVARIPYAREMDVAGTILQRILEKIEGVEPIEEEPGDRAWRSNALYLGAFMHWHDGQFHWPVAYGDAERGLEWYIKYYTPEAQGWTSWRVYEAADKDTVYEYDDPLDYDEALAEWSGADGSDYAIVNAGGHGHLEGDLSEVPFWWRDWFDEELGEQHAVYADVHTADALDETRPSLVLSGSCLTAYPEEPQGGRPVWWNNMARALIRKGAVGVVGSMRETMYRKGWDNPVHHDATPTLYAYLMEFMLTDGGRSMGMAHADAIRNYYDKWYSDEPGDRWWEDLQQQLMCCSCVTGDPSLRREGAQPVESPPEWVEPTWHIFSLPINPCEPDQIRLFGGPLRPIHIFDPTRDAWIPYSGDLDTDRAYRMSGPPNLTYYGCEATVDQIIDLEPAGTHWIGTARNDPTNTEGWRIKCMGDPVKLDQAAENGWIGEDMAVFNNLTGDEETFKVWQWRDIDPWHGVKIQVLLTPVKLELIIPREG